MRDSIGGRFPRVLAILIVVIPAVLVVAALISYFTVVQVSQGVGVGAAVVKVSLAIIGLYAFVVFGWWLLRAARR